MPVKVGELVAKRREQGNDLWRVKSIPIAFDPVSVSSTICVSRITLSRGMSIIAIIRFIRSIRSGEPLSQIAFSRRSIAIEASTD